MPPSPEPIGLIQTDPRLQAFLAASSQDEADRELIRLMEAAEPLLTGCLGRRGHDAHQADTEEDISEARTQLLLRLQNLRRESGAGGAAIADLGAYAVAVARRARAGNVRRRHPARAMLLNRLRYLLEGRTNQRGFALWTGSGGETWSGFEGFRDRTASADAEDDKLSRLLADPRAVAPEIFGPGGGEASLPLAGVVAAVFRWLGTPVRLRDLVDAVAEWQGVRPGRGEALVVDAAGDEEAAFMGGMGGSEPSPHEALRWKEYLDWLLREVAELTLRQRSAFLLHSSCLREMESLGLTGIRHAAALLGLPPEGLAEHWARLPLEDRMIAVILDVEIQQVINLRKVARNILGRAWQKFLHEN